jgi:hypothetical protein
MQITPIIMPKTAKKRPFSSENDLKNDQNQGNLRQNHQGQSHHKLGMARFMADEQHEQQHRHAAAQPRYGK